MTSKEIKIKFVKLLSQFARPNAIYELGFNRSKVRKKSFLYGFNLIELLIVMGILGILAGATLLIINPVEMLRQTRDAKRIADIQAINNALTFFKFNEAALGDPSLVYVSLPSTQANCSGLGLPPLPAGLSYACETEADYRKVDGTGWIPVNFTVISGGSPLSLLPIDPINTTSPGNYYTYMPGGSWELTALMESKEYLIKSSSDGGDSILYERGTNLSLVPIFKTTYSFDDFPTTASNDKSPRWWKYTGSGTATIISDNDEAYLRASGYIWYEWQENIPFNPNALYRISCRVRQITDPTSGGKYIYCGVAGVAANGSTMLNVSGTNSHSSQHYIAASGQSLTAGAGYATFTGYFRGTGTPAGGQGSDINNPKKLYPGAAYFRPLFILNYSAGNGVAYLDMEIVEIIQ